MVSSTEDRQPEYIPFPCYMEPDPRKLNDGLERLEDVLLSDVKPTPGRTIFFHETKCHSPHTQHIMNFTARQACSIESAALNNPNFQVFVLFASPTYLPKAADQKLPVIEAMKSYKNVHFRQLNIWRYARDTPIEGWVNKGELFRSSFLTEHTSDLLRLMSLYRFGGIYMDIDVVVLRSLENVPLNYVGAQEPDVLCNAVISLEPTGRGHEIAEIFLRDFQKNYNGNLYVNNGPSLMGRVAQQICGKKSIKEIVADNKECNGFQVFNSTAFFPIPWQQWRLFFEPRELNKTMVQGRIQYSLRKVCGTALS